MSASKDARVLNRHCVEHLVTGTVITFRLMASRTSMMDIAVITSTPFRNCERGHTEHSDEDEVVEENMTATSWKLLHTYGLSAWFSFLQKVSTP